jgi:hypothetical protein
MKQSLCEKCALMREIITPKGSRFLLCQLSKSEPAYPKYPPQPIVRCGGYQEKEKTGKLSSSE